MNKKHDKIFNGGSLVGNLFLILAFVAILVFKILVINKM